MFGRQLRERDPEEEDGPGVWGRAGSGKGKGDSVRALGSWQAGQAGQWGGAHLRAEWGAGPAARRVWGSELAGPRGKGKEGWAGRASALGQGGKRADGRGRAG